MRQGPVPLLVVMVPVLLLLVMVVLVRVAVVVGEVGRVVLLPGGHLPKRRTVRVRAVGRGLLRPGVVHQRVLVRIRRVEAVHRRWGRGLDEVLLGELLLVRHLIWAGLPERRLARVVQRAVVRRKGRL